MRVRLSRWSTVFILTLNVLFLYYSWQIFASKGYLTLKISNTESNKIKLKPLKRISKLVTLVLAEFNQNVDITPTIEYLTKDFPHLRIIVLNSISSLLSKNATKNVKFLPTSPKLRTSYEEQYPLYHIKTKYVLFAPDGIRIVNRHSLQNILNNAAGNTSSYILAIPTTHDKRLDCLRASLHPQNWSFILQNIDSINCDIVLGQHAVLVEREVLQRLPNAFLLPFPYALYFQTAAQRVQVKIYDENDVLATIKPQIGTKKQLERLYNTFDVKFVRKNRLIEWYGCSKDTPSCIKQINGVPAHIHAGKHTPPCCLANLRKTALHLFGALEAAGVRYWLTGGSLLGALKTGDIVPWDVDIDVGVQRHDIARCKWFVLADRGAAVDANGFVWERVNGARWYRVYYSRVNRVYVNVYVYRAVNGTMMTVEYRDFPERFLHPMASVEFLGRFVPAPNNIHDFLEVMFDGDYADAFKYPEPNKFKVIL